MLVVAGFRESVDFLVNNFYPNKKHKYDFFFPKMNVYVEIAGMMQNDIYKNNVETKQKLYDNVLIIEPHQIETHIGDIINELRKS
jgi:hypothetical protein